MMSADAALHESIAGTVGIGRFVPDAAPGFDEASIIEAAERAGEAVWVVGDTSPRGTRLGVAWGGRIESGPSIHGARGEYTAYALLPAVCAELLGDRGFCEEHGCRYPYVTGAMATGIASVDLAVAGARAGFLSYFGAAGLSVESVERALVAIVTALGTATAGAWGANLIHSPDDPALEDALVDLYLARGVERIEASAFMQLAPSIVRFGSTGLQVDRWGRILRPHRVMVKLSRLEVARQFLQPPPAAMLEELVRRGALTEDEAALAALIPVADDVTGEADSGGHTDGRPLLVLLPAIQRLNAELTPAGGWPRPIRVGAAGGLGDPESVAAAFAAGADYVVTGSVNQTALESGTSDLVRAMLAEATFADVMLAPAADMFELGAKVQVLRRGTMYAPRARRLGELHHEYAAWDEIPADVRARLEQDVFQASFGSVWEKCVQYWSKRDRTQLERAERDERHRMALVFRWYLGQASRWAREGVAERKNDFQVWCGPAMGAFNSWTAGTHLAQPSSRTVADIGLNLLAGAVQCTRAAQLRAAGVPVPASAFRFVPRPIESAS